MCILSNGCSSCSFRSYISVDGASSGHLNHLGCINNLANNEKLISNTKWYRILYIKHMSQVHFKLFEIISEDHR